MSCWRWSSHATVAEPAASGVGGFGRLDAGSPRVALQPLAMKAQLLGQIGVEPVSVKPVT